MKHTRSAVALVAAAMGALTFVPAAAAQENAAFVLDMAAYFEGQPITVSADRAQDCVGPVTSAGFAAPIELKPDGPDRVKGLGTAVTKIGDYEATATCAGKPVTVKFTVSPAFYFPEDVVEAGNTIDVHRNVTAMCNNPVTSKGFVEPINITYKTEGWLRIGRGKVIDTPGTYEASMECWGETVTRTFTIKARAGQPKQQQKTPIVKPKGAPQTGAGGTATE